MTTNPPSIDKFYTDLPSSPLSGRLTVPITPGVYVLGMPGKILYIGEGANLSNRLTKQGHVQCSAINKLAFNAFVKWYSSEECGDSRFRDRLESALISELSPVFNVPHHAVERVSVGLPSKVSDRLRSQAWNRQLPLSVWCGMVLGAQAEYGVNGGLY